MKYNLKQVVDVHCHVIGSKDMISEELMGAFENLLAWDCGAPTPEVLLEEMDKAGVQYAVLQAYDIKDAGMEIPNTFVAEVLKQYPERFICGYASADPIKRGTDAAIGMLEEAYGMGLRGLKLHPLAMQFLPNNRDVYPLYEKCIEYNIPVGFHIQPTPGLAMCRLKFCDIVPIDELAHDLPELKIQICHFGKYPMPPDVLDLMCCLKNNENVYTDTSAPMPISKEGIPNTFFMIKQFGLADKAMFGTDFPVQPQSWWIECLDQSNLSEEEAVMVMGTNALKFVGREDLLE